MVAVPASIGISSILVLLLGAAPLLQSPGLPPLPEDPVLSRVAPEECLLYASWPGRAIPDAASANHTEALLADGDFQRLFGTVESELLRVLRRESDDEKGRFVIEALDLLQMALGRPAVFFVGGFAPAQDGLDVQMAFVARMGEETARARRCLERMEQLVPREAREQRPTSSAPPLTVLPLPERAPKVFYGFVGDDLVIAVGERTAVSVMSALSGEGAVPAWLRDVRASMAAERPAAVLYLDVAGVRRATGAFHGGRLDAALQLTGLGNVRSVASVAGLEGEGFVQHVEIAFDGEPSGVLSLIGGTPLTTHDLAAVPADATLAAAGRVDPGAAYAELRAMLGQVDPRGRNDLTELLGNIETELGIRLDADLFDTLGDSWALYNSPGDGGLLITGLTLVLKVDDRATLERALDRFVDAIRLEQGGSRDRVTIKDALFEGERVYFLNAIGEELPVAPAWCLTDDALVVAAYPQMVKSYLLRRGGGATLADVPEVAALWEGDQAPAVVAYADMAAVFKTAYPLVHPLANLICSKLQDEGLAVDVSLLPAARSILPHLTPVTRAVFRTDHGIRLTTRGSLPVGGAGLGSAAPLLATMLLGVRTHVARDVSASATVLQQEQLAEAKLKLGNIGTALNLYEVEYGELPDSLEDLVDAGYLAELPTASSGMPFEYYGKAGEDGQGARSPRPVAALSQPLPNGQRVVLYSDGRVESIPEPVFQHQRRGG